MPAKDLFKVAEQTSLETAKELILNCGGWNIYLPNTTRIKGALRNYVRKHFTGNNHKELALRLGVAESNIYKMLGEKEK
ncbi:MAG: hypothetical protein JNJ85_08830 [Candidatus Kapabacteria bacterium]|nr:hypothetical protein [Candidatus Kapabacteria bacterium]